jgi:feruloyl esterase
MEAQRFPDDYDGIIAGASANPPAVLNAWQLSLAQAVLRVPASYIPPSKYPIIHQAVLDACDVIDGVKDGLISDPARCHFDPQVLACKGDDGPTCLTSAQVAAAHTIMNRARTRNGREIFPGYEPGNELGWGAVIGGPEPTPLTLDRFRYIVFKNPNWDWRTFDLDRDVARANESVENRIHDAVDPNLSAFVRHHGKLLMYHGWSDQLVAPRASVNYYNSVLTVMGGAAKTADWIRLFMVPGMGHCRGGEGPDSFDTIGALEQWVEKGNAPEQIIASHIANGEVDRTRPLCPYPQVAEYKGTGSTDEAGNFICKTR